MQQRLGFDSTRSNNKVTYAMSDPLNRYLELGTKDSLAIPFKYPLACKDLSFILRHAYPKSPKNLQSFIFLDVILAFRLLPDMERKDAEAAAHLLFQSVEAALPRQKKVQAVTHFKNAKIALKRRIRTRDKDKHTGFAELPHDVLVHIFSFLDLRSLLQVSQVCWMWNSASSNNHLWKKQYDIVFGNGGMCSGLQSKMSSRNKKLSLLKETLADNVVWMELLKSRLTGIPSKFKSHRGYCKHCRTIVWLSNLKCGRENFQPGAKQETHQVKPVKISEVVNYVLHGVSHLESSSSESDGNSTDEELDFAETGSKLWAYPCYL